MLRTPYYYLSRFVQSMGRGMRSQFLLGCALLVVSAATFNFGLPEISVRNAIDMSQVQPYGKVAYRVPVPPPPMSAIFEFRSDSVARPMISTARLLEDGVRIGRPHSVHAVLAEKGLGLYSHWRNELIFTTSDNSDPTKNGRVYFIEGRAALKWSIQYAIFLLVAVLALSGGFLILRESVSSKGNREDSFGNAHNSGGIKLRGYNLPEIIILIAPFLPVALLLSIGLAPVVSVDSQVLMTFQINDYVLPHYGLLYPYLTRTLNLLVESIYYPLSSITPSGYNDPIYSKSSIIVIVLFQHVLYLAASAYFAKMVSRTRKARYFIVFALYFFPISFIYNHTLLTESISLSILLFIFSTLIQIHNKIQKKKINLRKVISKYYCFVFLGVLTKHVFIIFAFLPLAYIVFIFVGQRKLGARKAILLPAGMGALVGCIGVFWMANFVPAFVMKVNDIEPRSALGRAFTYRLAAGELVANYPRQFFRNDEERKAVIASLILRTQDRTLVDVIDIIGNTEKPWVEPYQEIINYVIEKCFNEICENKPLAVTDILLGKVAMHSIITTDTRLWRDVFLRVTQYFAPRLVISNEVWEQMRARQRQAGSDPGFNQAVKGLQSQTLSQFPYQLWKDFGSTYLYVQSLSNAYGSLLWFVVFLICLRSGFAKTGFLLTLFLTALGYAFAMSLVTVYIHRYGIVMAWIAWIAFIVAILPWPSKSSGSESEPARIDEPNEQLPP